MALMSENFEMYAGDEKTIQLTVSNSAGLSVNIDGFQVFWKVAKRPNSAALISKSTDAEGGITITAPASSGALVIVLDSADTSELRGVFYHEAWTVDTQGNQVTVSSGYLTIHGSLKLS